jgi:hypothetical protein
MNINRCEIQEERSDNDVEGKRESLNGKWAVQKLRWKEGRNSELE